MLCVQCGLRLTEGQELCWHHHIVHPDGWSESNRRMCDFFHRGVIDTSVPNEPSPFMFRFLEGNA